MKATRYILFLLLLISGFSLVEATTPSDVLAKSAAKARAAKGVKATFSISGAGRNLSGELMASGTKFMVKAGGMESWYNGRDLYSYNPTTKEVTVVKPTSSELAEINPLVYLNMYGNSFTPSFSKTGKSGKYVIDLKPKSKKIPVKNVTVTLDAKSYMPERFTVTSLDGSVSDVTVKSLNYSATVPATAFEYPKARFPKATIVDLR